jgi:hypothetical protein
MEALFLDALLSRAKQAVESPNTAPTDERRMPEAAQVLLALIQLDEIVQRDLPGYVERVNTAKAALNSLSSPESRRDVERSANNLNQLDRPTYESSIDQIEQERDSDKRDHLIASLVLGLGRIRISEETEKLADKIQSEQTRAQVLAWFYFIRTQQLAKDGSFDDAMKMARKISEVERRAYLFFEIASAIDKKLGDRNRVREILDELITTASKASNSQEKARALLGTVHLYSKFDSHRAYEVMIDAIKVMNAIKEKDLSSTAGFQQIIGKNFRIYGGFQVEGFSLENVFRELGKSDYQGTLALRKNLEDKSQRVTAMIALAMGCLETPETRK